MGKIKALIEACKHLPIMDRLFIEPKIKGAESELKELYIEKINKYYDGVKDGVYLYAWWSDSGLQVGTSGKSFSDAVIEIEKDRAEALSKVSL